MMPINPAASAMNLKFRSLDAAGLEDVLSSECGGAGIFSSEAAIEVL